MKIDKLLYSCIFVGCLLSCSDNGDPSDRIEFKNPYSNPLTDYSAADPTVWKENDHSFYVYCTNTWNVLKSSDLVHWEKSEQKLF